MNDKIAETIAQMKGMPCWRKEVGRGRSLSLGFGGQVHRKTALVDKLYGLWELGTYRCAWRVAIGGTILCASNDPCDTPQALNAVLQQAEFGSFESLSQSNAFDVRVTLDNGLCIEFLATISDDDECFHIFGPNKGVIEYSVAKGWRMGRSDEPREENPTSQP